MLLAGDVAPSTIFEVAQLPHFGLAILVFVLCELAKARRKQESVVCVVHLDCSDTTTILRFFSRAHNYHYFTAGAHLHPAMYCRISCGSHCLHRVSYCRRRSWKH